MLVTFFMFSIAGNILIAFIPKASKTGFLCNGTYLVNMQFEQFVDPVYYHTCIHDFE